MGLRSYIKKLVKKALGKTLEPQDLLDFFEKVKEENALPESVSDLILSILELSDRQVEEIMVPRIDMVVISTDATLDEAVKIYRKKGFSKLPVIRERTDNVIGILYIKELLKHLHELKELKAQDLAKPAHYVPYSKKVLDTLKEMQKKRISIAIVVDEFGSVAGLVTLEDILEEIVGEIYEEFDKEEVLVRHVDEDTYIVNAKIDLYEASEKLGVDLESEEVNTLGGYIIENLERVPQVGEKFVVGPIEVEVLDATQQRIKEVKVRVIKEKE
ncbi:MAG: hemolysin family protein [Candidatus Hydrothermia bacterium]|jgi:CBS domain containing-hemolysin-like protein